MLTPLLADAPLGQGLVAHIAAPMPELRPPVCQPLVAHRYSGVCMAVHAMSGSCYH